MTVSAHSEEPRSGVSKDPYLEALAGPLGDELETAIAAREADGQPWWVERFGDLTSPERHNG